MYLTNALEIQKFVCFFFMKVGHFYIQDLGENGVEGGDTKGINVYFFFTKAFIFSYGTAVGGFKR